MGHYYEPIRTEKNNPDMKKKKIILEVIYGSEACNALDEFSVNTVKHKIKTGDICGALGKYQFSTEKDREQAIQILLDADGWENSFWTKKD